jgi:hypothetical protein
MTIEITIKQDEKFVRCESVPIDINDKRKYTPSEELAVMVHDAIITHKMVELGSEFTIKILKP